MFRHLGGHVGLVQRSVALGLLACLALVSACRRPAPTEEKRGAAERRADKSDAAIDPSLLAAFAPLPAVMTDERHPLTPARVQLGRMLYYDTRLSKNHDIACNSCHQLDRYGVDNEATSPGHKRARGERNSPSTYNAAGHFRQFWDGRAADVEAQAQGPVTNPIEMALASPAAAEAVLRSIPGYQRAFAAAFPDDKAPITFAHMARAIGAFERKLVTPGRFDAFLRGKCGALTAAEKQGLKAFVASGCMACHNGPYLGGQSYQKLGNIKPWPNQKDLGRYSVTNDESDKMRFKVPSLRNVAKTAPYFHDGSVKTLAGAVRKMAWHQLGRKLEESDVRSIVIFLEALTGELPKKLVQKPALPASGPRTPKPDPT
ncbi:MAG: cytochrome-c peroxidase [Polyangiales bacterium]